MWNKTVHAMWFYLYYIQNQAALMYDEKWCVLKKEKNGVNMTAAKFTPKSATRVETHI